MSVGEGLVVVAAGAVAVFAGIVAYKIVKKKKPDLLKKTAQSLSELKERTSEVIVDARDAFRQGYANA